MCALSAASRSSRAFLTYMVFQLPYALYLCELICDSCQPQCMTSLSTRANHNAMLRPVTGHEFDPVTHLEDGKVHEVCQANDIHSRPVLMSNTTQHDGMTDEMCHHAEATSSIRAATGSAAGQHSAATPRGVLLYDRVACQQSDDLFLGWQQKRVTSYLACSTHQ